MKEIWKVYKDTRKAPNGCLYEVSNLGNVKANGILIKLRDRNYFEFGGHYRVHRAVAELFIPNPDNKRCVDHINTNKHDNRVENLRWVTHHENNMNSITIEHMRISKSNISLETRQKMSESAKHKIISLETRQKMSESRKGKKPTANHIWIHLGDKTKFVHEDYLDYWLDDGWLLGRKKKK